MIFLTYLILLHPLPVPAQSSIEPPHPFEPGESAHGYSDFETLPDMPSKLPEDSHRSAPLPDSSMDIEDTPRGLFLEITTAKGFDEDLEFRRGHVYYPVQPTDAFSTDAPAVYVVFRVHKHYAPYQVIGRLYPEEIQDLQNGQWFDEDIVSLALEDESGYLKFFPPPDGWEAGRYRIEIYVGYEVNPLNRMGTLRFKMKKS